MSAKIVGVECEGVVRWHVPGVAGPDYATLCGLDGEDPSVGQRLLGKSPRGTKVNCEQCSAVWRGLRALNLRESDFA